MDHSFGEKSRRRKKEKRLRGKNQAPEIDDYEGTEIEIETEIKVEKGRIGRRTNNFYDRRRIRDLLLVLILSLFLFLLPLSYISAAFPAPIESLLEEEEEERQQREEGRSKEMEETTAYIQEKVEATVQEIHDVSQLHLDQVNSNGHSKSDDNRVGNIHHNFGDNSNHNEINHTSVAEVASDVIDYFSSIDLNLGEYENLASSVHFHGYNYTQPLAVEKRDEPVPFGSAKFLKSLFGSGGLLLSLIQYFHDGTKDLAVINKHFYVEQEYANQNSFELTTVQELIRFILYGCSRGSETYFSSQPVVGEKVIPMPRWKTFGKYRARRHGGSAIIYTKDDGKCALTVCQTNDKMDTKTNFRVNTEEHCFPSPLRDSPNFYHTHYTEHGEESNYDGEYYHLSSRVHKGFLYSYLNLKHTTSIMEDWHRLQEDGTCEPDRSYLTGFSLGAALAHIMALDGWKGKPVTFGTPKFLAGEIPEKIVQDYAGCRVDLFADPVPNGPCLKDEYLCSFDPYPYRHVGPHSVIYN